jgi:type I restriction enzyme M protein
MSPPPARRRLALEQLGRKRLNELTQRYGLDVGDRRVLSHHIDALVRARSVDFAELLASLKREELQAICEALGRDRGGREKEALVQRILWSADDILRGSIDSSDYKNYIFGLLFLKRLPDFRQGHPIHRGPGAPVWF